MYLQHTHFNVKYTHDTRKNSGIYKFTFIVISWRYMTMPENYKKCYERALYDYVNQILLT